MNNFSKEVSSSVLLLALSLGVGFQAAPAAASNVEALCSGAIALSDGQWAGYAVDAPLMRDKQKYRYAVVGTEAGNFWLEFEAAMPMGQGAVVMKILIPGWPYAKDAVTRVLMQLPIIEGMDAMPPMEMPPASIQKDDIADPIRMACAEAQQGVEDTVTVPAGTFSALRIPLRQVGKDVWLSSDVPFGIVKMTDEEGYGTELTAYGNDAKPAITAAPHKVPGMQE
jgi:hypothetical protein